MNIITESSFISNLNQSIFSMNSWNYYTHIQNNNYNTFIYGHRNSRSRSLDLDKVMPYILRTSQLKSNVSKVKPYLMDIATLE